MAAIPEDLLNDIAEETGLPAMSPALCRILSPVIELEMKKIIRQADKFRHHGKSNSLMVEHLNSALHMNKVEEIYGLSSSAVRSDKDSYSTRSLTVEAERVDLVKLARQPPPRPPQAPELNLHWLAINNVQPKIPENPLVIVAEGEGIPTDLPREMQFFYSRTTSAILSCDNNTLPSVFQSFESDPGLQELLPYFSRFIYRQIKNTTRSLPILMCLVKACRSLLLNPSLHHEFHLHQLIPAMLTCVVGANVSSSPTDDHWNLRSQAAEVVAIIVKKYRDSVPDLQPRISKTYLDAFGADKSLVSLYGGIIGLTILGHQVIRNLLLPIVDTISERIQQFSERHLGEGGTVDGAGDMEVDGGAGGDSGGVREGDRRMKRLRRGGEGFEGRDGELSSQETRIVNEEIVARCKAAALTALGKFMLTSMRFPDGLPEDSGSGSKRLSSKEKKTLRKSLTSDDALVADLGEALVPYYVSSSVQLDHARMFI